MWWLLFLFVQAKSSLSCLNETIDRLEKHKRAENKDSVIYYIKELRKRAGEVKEDHLTHYINGLYFYKLITSDSAYMKEIYVDSAIHYLEQSVRLKINFGDAWVLLSSLYGMKGMLNYTKITTWAKKFQEAIEKAKEVDPENPLLYYQEGLSLLFRPKVFGGGKDKAKKSFERALELYKKYKDRDLLWGYLECKAFLGYTLESMNQKDSAQRVYKEILREDQDYKWVKRQLDSLTSK